MKSIWKLVAVCILIGMLGWTCKVAEANTQQVIVVNIKGEIDGSQVALVNRAVSEAEKNNAAAIIVEMDTFGGLVDSAVKIRDIVSQTPITTICYIKNRAWSAGALIAIAHQHIAIVPGGSIGAAEPIPATEKTIAALKAEFAATANKSGRNVKVAEAMVDKTVGLPGYAEPGQILALTDYQAKEVGYADILALDRQGVLSHYGLTDCEIVEYHIGWTEKIAGWFSDPTIKSFLVSIIFLAVFTEIKTAGMGVAAGIGLLAAMLFFGSQWLTGLAGWFELILFISGILLILVELFIPGFGFWGVSGVGCILASLFFTLGGNVTALSLLSISLLIAIIAFGLLLKYLPSSKLWDKLILKDAETKEAGFSSSYDYTTYLGKEGVVLTLLRPSGLADFDGMQLDVVSEGQYIEAGARVKVVSITGSRIVVKRI